MEPRNCLKSHVYTHKNVIKKFTKLLRKNNILKGNISRKSYKVKERYMKSESMSVYWQKLTLKLKLYEMPIE